MPISTGRSITPAFSAARRFLLQSYDYLICVVAAGMFAASFLAWSIFAVPIRLFLPARAARSFGRSANMYCFRTLLALVSRSCRVPFRP